MQINFVHSGDNLGYGHHEKITFFIKIALAQWLFTFLETDNDSKSSFFFQIVIQFSINFDY